MRKIVKVAFCDWWKEFDCYNNFIIDAIQKEMECVVVNRPEEAEFVFCSIFGYEYLNYSCPRIVFSGENCIPDFNSFDYGIGFDYLSIGDRYYRYPLYLACYQDDCEKMIRGANLTREEAISREFCAMVVSNSEFADPMRDMIFDAISKYKKVASGGKYRNNIGNENGVTCKEEFIKKYKFSLACENSSHRGYCTEKLIQAFAYGTVPIYWGDPDVEIYFNKDAFINVNRFTSLYELCKFVMKLDSDNEQYIKMLNAPKIVNPDYELTSMENKFADWICKIVCQPVLLAYRRNRYGWVLNNEKNIMENKNKLEKMNQIEQKISKWRYRLEKIPQKVLMHK